MARHLPARLLVALGLVAVACEDPPPTDPSAAITPMALSATDLELAGGESAPDFDRPTLLHFWATWCAPCRRELPTLLELAGDVEGVRVLAVSDEPWSTLEAYFAPEPVPRWIARDPAGELARALGVRTLPDSYLVDAAGVARRRVAGSRDWASPPIRAWVLSLRAEERPR